MSGGEGEQEFDLKLIIKFFEEGFQVINATLDNLQSPSKFKSPWWQTYEDEYSNGKTRRRREGGLEHNFTAAPLNIAKHTTTKTLSHGVRSAT